MWTAEAPWLYALVLELEDPDGRTVDVECCRLGLRTVGVSPQGVLQLNGRKLWLTGVNRHRARSSL